MSFVTYAQLLKCAEGSTRRADVLRRIPICADFRQLSAALRLHPMGNKEVCDERIQQSHARAQ
jgi:hypothetical protein